MSLTDFLRQIAPDDARRGRFGRAGFQPGPAVEALEDRTLLAGTGRDVRTITATDGGAVNVDAADTQEVIVAAGADIGTLTINGEDGCDIQVTFQAGSRASSLNVEGADAAETVTLDGTVGTVTFQGRGGADEFVSTGTVEGSMTFNGDGGADLLRFQGAATVGGNLGGNMGAGADTFEILDTATVDNVNFALGANADTFNFTSTSATTGNFTLSADGGADTLTFGAGSAVGGNENVDAGAGADEVTFGSAAGGHAVVGNQVVDLGDSGTGTDTLTFGADDIDGGSTVRWTGDVDISEAAERDIESLYTFEGTDGTATADLTGGASDGSDVAGDFSWTNSGPTDLTVQMQITQANFTVNTGSGAGTGADDVTVQDGTAVGGNFNVTLGGDEAVADTLELLGTVAVGDPDAGVNGNMTVNLGGGADGFTSEMLTVNGNQTLNLGTAPAGTPDRVELGEDDINGSSSINFGGGLDLTENGPRDIQSDYSITAQGGDGAVTADLTGGSTVGGNFSMTTFGETAADFADLTVEQGNFTLNTGSGSGTGADDVTFNGENVVEGNFNVTLGGSETVGDSFIQESGTLQIGDPAAGVNGNMNLALGGGNDTVEFAAVTVNGNQTLNLGDSDGGSGDAVTFGDDDVNGGSTVNWGGAATITETAAREIQSDYALNGGDSPATLDLTGGSTVGGNFSATTTGPTTADFEDFTVNRGNFSLNTGTGAGTGADDVTFSGTNTIEGNFEAILGGSESVSDSFVQTGVLNVGDESESIEGNFTLCLGGGDDVVSFQELNVNGDETIKLGPGEGGSGGGGDSSVITLPGGRITGDAVVEYSGDVTIVQTGPRTVTGDYIFRQTGEGSVDANLGGDNAVGGDFRFEADGEADLTVGFDRVGGDVTFDGGETGADTVTVNAAGAADGVADVGGAITLTGGAGDDSFTVGDDTAALGTYAVKADRIALNGGAGSDMLSVSAADLSLSGNNVAVTTGGGTEAETDEVSVSNVIVRGGGVYVLSPQDGAAAAAAQDVTVENAAVATVIDVRTGAGDDVVNVTGDQPARNNGQSAASRANRVDIRTGAGADDVTVENTAVKPSGNNIAVRTGAGGDTVLVQDSVVFGGGVYVVSESGAAEMDDFTVTDTAVSTVISLTGGAGDDTLLVQSSAAFDNDAAEAPFTRASRIDVRGMAGVDDIDVLNTLVRADGNNIAVRGGAGADDVNIDGSVSRSSGDENGIYVVGGAGNDTLDGVGSEGNVFSFLGGGGADDTLTADSIVGNMLYGFGAGDDFTVTGQGEYSSADPIVG